MTRHLKVVSGPANGTTIPLGEEPFVIGRGEEGLGKLADDAEISRRHARISGGDGALVVEDLGSTNGTIVNGTRIGQGDPVELHPGDRIELGTTTLMVEGMADAQVTAPRRVIDPELTVSRPLPDQPPRPPPPADGAGPSLRVVAGRTRGLTIALGEEPLVIGRSEEGEGNLGDDPELSRRHAQVSEVAGRLLIEDLGSTHGTFVNGRQILAATVVTPGDAIWIGTTTMVVVTPDEPVPEVAPVEPPTPSGEAGLLSRFAELSDRRPGRILVAIGVFFLIAAALGGPVAGILNVDDAFVDPSAESVGVIDQISAASGETPGAQLLVLVRGTGNTTVDSAETRARVEEIEAGIKREKLVSRTASFYSTDSDAFVSKDRRSTFVAAFMKKSEASDREEVAKKLTEEFGDPPEVKFGGGAVSGFQLQETVEKDLGKAEALAFPLLFALSLFVFRGVVAALLPLFVGILTIVTTFLALRIINNFVGLSPFALNVVIGLGLGLAIDYSLFIVSRYREELAKVGRGRPPSRIYGAVRREDPDARFAGSESEALRRAVFTAGRTVLYSAITVAIALASLMIFPQPFLYSMGIGGATCALVAVTVSLVALPALLAVLGPRVNALAPKRWQRAAEKTANQEQSGPWYRLSQIVMRRPGLVAALSATFLLLLGLPALGINFTGVDIKAVPKEATARQVDTALSRDFAVNPAAGDITILARAPRSDEQKVADFAADVRRLPGANTAVETEPRPLKGGLWEIALQPRGSPLDTQTVDLVEKIRAGPNPFPVTVAGDTASFLDQKESIASHLPLALLILCVTTVVVLFLMTGSIVLPLKSLLMNALSVSAAFGLLVLIFQEGNLEGVLGFESPGALDLSQPVLLFALAFGLSTDYAVFLLTRIKEARTAGASEKDSVAIGLERTGRIVTQAALLFCIAIGAFATSSVIFIKEVGVGTALAVILDATIIRAFLVPALMALLGANNWWAPAPLRRLHEKIGLSEG